jgi:RNA polymerase sigma-70 factor (ECF subfamily)
MRDDPEFSRLVDEHYESLARFAVSLTGQEAEAADLVQETFLRWARKGHQLIDVRRVKSWLFTTLYREFLGHRRHRTSFQHQPLDDVAAELPSVAPSPPSRVDWETALAGLASLDPAFRAPVTLFYLEDYSYPEIAEILGIPLGTVKSRISRGIAALQQFMVIQAEASPRSNRQRS